MNAKNSLGMSQFDGATVYAALAAFGVILVDRAICIVNRAIVAL